jgi:RNA-directed DNA polymerase
MNECGKSDSSIEPAKPPNNPACAGAEVVEEKGLAEGNAADKTRPGHSAGQDATSALDRVRQAAVREKGTRFTALLHHVDVERLWAAYRVLNPDAAVGVDEVTWHEYGQDLWANLTDLHERVHRGSYRARPARRAYIPKSDGRLRPLGIAALEDKIVQRAVCQVLNAIYEADFLRFSYGCRQGSGPHDALDALVVGLERRKVSWVLDADIRDFFSDLDHDWLMRFVEHRIGDPRVVRLIRKWLKAGVVEDGQWAKSEQGVPQGATISPLLANIYLHYVLDVWVRDWRRRHARGDVIIVRYVDDFVVGFQHHADATRFWADLRRRLGKFNLELADNKTRLVEFGRFAAQRRARRGQGRPETFAFLGFVHYCTTTRDGRFRVGRRTIAARMAAKLRKLKEELMRRRHQPVPAQGAWLASVLRGYVAYYAVPGNIHAVSAFCLQARRLWYRALRRRSQRTSLDWERMGRLCDRWLPTARISHPWPQQRFDARTQGKSPVR